MLRLGVLGAAFYSGVFAAPVAAAQVEPIGESIEELPFVPRLGSAAGVGLSVEGYVGMSVYHSERALRGHGVAGGIARGRASYLTVGGFAERADEDEFGRWRAFGGFAGVRLPFSNWVDFEGSVGGGSRTHAEDDERYNAGAGYEWSTPFALVRFGLSDRSSDEAPLALRVGVEMFAMFDLKRHDQPWQVVYPRAEGIPPLVFNGETPLGGSSIGVLVSVGLDLWLSPTSEKRKASVKRD